MTIVTAEDHHGSAATSRPSPLSIVENLSLDGPASPARSPRALFGRHGSTSPPSNRSSLVLDIPSRSAADIALSALQHMPVPVIVLGPLKTVTMANEAMAKLFCMSNSNRQEHGECNCELGSTREEIYGKTLSQVGVDLLHNDVPIWVDWESYIDTIGEDSCRRPSRSGDTTPTLNPTVETPHADDNSGLDLTTVHDVAVDVIVSQEHCAHSQKKRDKSVGIAGVQCSMIISTWWTDGAKHYTLTFVSTTATASSTPATRTTRTIPKKTKNFDSPGSMSSSSSNSGRRSQSASSPSSTLSSPSPYIPLFPPTGPISRNGPSASASVLQKATRLRGALLNAMDLPCYALWKDHSVGIPNRALMRLCSHDEGAHAGADFLARFTIYDEHFSRVLDYNEFPIIETINSQKAAKGSRIGLKDPVTDAEKVYDCGCHTVTDDETGEFLGAIVILKDVTDYVDQIAAQRNFTQKQFEYICNHIPPLVWTTTVDGKPDWFSNRWYDYTGLSPQQSLGAGWITPFHPEDVPESARRWTHSVATGEEYSTEYRCRRYDGEYRWMLGSARPMRDDSGKIFRWFGTCQDVHDAVEAREAQKRTREQLHRVMDSANLTLCAVDLTGTVKMLQGSCDWLKTGELNTVEEIIGTNIFDPTAASISNDIRERYAAPLHGILSGASVDETCELLSPSGTSFRHRYKPLLRTARHGGVEGGGVLDGAIIVSSDVTTLRTREVELKVQEKENAKLVAKTLAAKEASRMKSSFLANMSHEIRTPIAGVIGMTELLSDMHLNTEQAECAENILRSANGLFSVINDILDFSKVESGHLDIEEVQFSLSVVIQDVNKMLSFAAIRKNLNYKTDVSPRIAGDLRVLGDPGRLRQVMTNILTNSIKFTSEGFVSLSAKVREEQEEVVEVEFTVEDTGIGIDEDTRKKLFTPFSQADSSTARRFGGTGLGLTISKNLVELMHGSITLDSNIGVGTSCVFCIPFKKVEYVPDGSPLVNLGAIPDRLQSDMSVSLGSEDRNGVCISPITTHERQPSKKQSSTLMNMSHDRIQQSAAPPKQEDSLLSDAEREKIHVLVVEDNPVNQQIAIKTIRKLNFSVNAVWNGKEAVDYLFGEDDGSKPRPDIVLMDVQMPILDGYKATQTIRRQPHTHNLTNVPIVAMTASAIQGDKEKCMRAGMDDYLAKPVKGKILEKMLVKWSVESRRRRRAVEQPLLQQQTNQESSSSPSHRGARPPLPHHASSSADIVSTGTRESPSPSPHIRSTAARLAETEDATRQRRAQLEERAMFLRDDKLLNVGQDPRLTRHHSDNSEHHAALPRPSHALTTANMASYNERMDEEGALEKPDELADPMRELLGEKVRSKRKLSGQSRTTDDAATRRPMN